MVQIYCVEDDAGIRELISCALKSGGYEIASFENGKDMLRELKKKKPDLILLDVMLPGDDGFTILNKLKNEHEYADIPVIMLTAKSSEIDKVTGLEGGADDYITKPFGIMEFLSRIKAVLRRSGRNTTQEGESAIRAGELLVDLQRRTVIYKKQEIVLTFKEFELLCYLMKHQGKAVSRDRLLEKVWGFQYEGETRTVDAHIKTLRKKLDSAGTEDIIQTVRGYGYKLM